MTSEILTTIAITLSSSLTVIGLLIGAFRNLSAKITSSNKELYLRIDRVKEQYVRRDDLDGHLQRIDTVLHEIREEQRRNNQQVLNILSQINK